MTDVMRAEAAPEAIAANKVTASGRYPVDAVRKIARELLESGEVKYVIGWERGSHPYVATPSFAYEPGETERLEWNPFCVPVLGKYLLDDRYPDQKIGIIAKGCDSRALIRLIQDNQFPRDKMVIIGVPCAGTVEASELPPAGRDSEVTIEDAGETYNLKIDGARHSIPKQKALRKQCLMCKYPNPLIYDYLVGEEIAPRQVPDEMRYKRVAEIEAMSTEERADYWNEQFSKCGRCNACRQVCPACSCLECIFDMDQPSWVDKITNLAENQVFHVIRAYHVAGRCVDCGECQRVCPAGIPLMELNRKIQKDLFELFNAPDAGTDLGKMPALLGYSVSDPEEFL